MTIQPEVERSVPLLDLQAQFRAIREETLAEVTRVIDSQKFILGADVQALEKDIADYSSTKFAVGCASGSDAILLALMALEVQPGDKVITTPYTFFATVSAICRVGAVPVFADVDPETFNLDVDNVRGALARHPETRVLMPVHLFGGCADMGPLLSVARDSDLWVIEDAAQSIGSEYNGRRAGSLGDIGCFSFFPSKNLGAFGDAGMLSTSDDELNARVRSLRAHGAAKKYSHDYIGINSRLDSLQAAVLRVKLRHLDSWTDRRRANADLYRRILNELRVPVTAPRDKEYQTRHIYNQFVILSPRRDQLQKFLTEHGIGTEVYYPRPMHLQKCFSHLGYKAGDFPVSERLANESLALPIYPELTADDIEYVCRKLKEFYS